jgi:hypothetical protein
MMPITANSMIPLAHIQVAERDYNVYISLCTVTKQMHIFKYNQLYCAYEVFCEEGEACQWLELPLTAPPRPYS